MNTKDFKISLEIRTKDIDNNEIDVDKIIEKINKLLANEWNVCGFSINELLP